jgi:large subunit ribosomal protein L5
MGLNDQSIFPEIDLDKVSRQQGMDITIVTSAATDDEAFDLLKMMGMPFAGDRKKKTEKTEEAAVAA